MFTTALQYVTATLPSLSSGAFPLLSLPVELILAVSDNLLDEADFQSLRATCTLLRSTLPRHTRKSPEHHCYLHAHLPRRASFDYYAHGPPVAIPRSVTDPDSGAVFVYVQVTKWERACQLFDFSGRLVRDLPWLARRNWFVCQRCCRVRPSSGRQKVDVGALLETTWLMRYCCADCAMDARIERARYPINL